MDFEQRVLGCGLLQPEAGYAASDEWLSAPASRGAHQSVAVA